MSEPGWYWVKGIDHPNPNYWEPRYWTGNEWDGVDPEIIGPRIPQPD